MPGQSSARQRSAGYVKTDRMADMLENGQIVEQNINQKDICINFLFQYIDFAFISNVKKFVLERIHILYTIFAIKHSPYLMIIVECEIFTKLFE